MNKDPFKEYLRESEPDKVNKGYAWSTAIGLQAVDGLKPSQYLIDTAIQNIEGNITIKEAQNLIDNYYEERPVHLSDDERTEEADKVSSRIAQILSETAFSFSPNEYISIHRKLFQGIYKHAGKIRVSGYKEVYFQFGGIAPFKGYAVFSCLLASFCSVCGSVGKWISPTKLKTISTF